MVRSYRCIARARAARAIDCAVDRGCSGSRDPLHPATPRRCSPIALVPTLRPCSCARGECPPNGPLMLAANHARTALTRLHTMQRHPVNRHHRACTPSRALGRTKSFVRRRPRTPPAPHHRLVSLHSHHRICPPLVAAAVMPPSRRRRRVVAVAPPPLIVAIYAALHQPARAHHCCRTPQRASLSPLLLPPLLPCWKPPWSPASMSHRPPARARHSHCCACLSLVAAPRSKPPPLKLDQLRARPIPMAQ